MEVRMVLVLPGEKILWGDYPMVDSVETSFATVYGLT